MTASRGAAGAEPTSRLRRALPSVTSHDSSPSVGTDGDGALGLREMQRLLSRAKLNNAQANAPGGANALAKEAALTNLRTAGAAAATVGKLAIAARIMK